MLVTNRGIIIIMTNPQKTVFVKKSCIYAKHLKKIHRRVNCLNAVRSFAIPQTQHDQSKLSILSSCGSLPQVSNLYVLRFISN